MTDRVAQRSESGIEETGRSGVREPNDVESAQRTKDADAKPGGPRDALPLGLIVPGMPQPFLCASKNPGWQRIADAFARVRNQLDALEFDVLLLYSTQWISVIGHQIQAHPRPRWVHVDPEFHELGSIPYTFEMDADFAQAYERAAKARGLHARTVAYEGFPIDTGSIAALKLLNPDNRRKACIVSCNMYADRAETVVLGKAALDALRVTGKRAVAVAVTALSNRMWTGPVHPLEDRISSLKDDEWNRKILEMLEQGRLEDVSQLARQFTKEANADQKFKAVWWLSSLMGSHNGFHCNIEAYEPIMGTGAAVVSFLDSGLQGAEQEFDEDDVEVFRGERNVLGSRGN